MADRDAALELNPPPFVRTLTTTPPMKPNVGGFDRILRVILGLGILGAGSLSDLNRDIERHLASQGK
jgi:hypothetical protein